MRRRLVAAAVACLGVLAGTGLAQAGESIGDGPWRGSGLDPGVTNETSVGALRLTGFFDRTPIRTMDVVLRATPLGGGPGCAIGSTGPSPEDASRGYVFNLTLSAPCNGRYLVEAIARTTRNAPPLAPADFATLDRIVDVAVPPADVPNVDAREGAGRTVTVTWSPPASRAADHLGYRVERVGPDGKVVNQAVGDVTSFVDTDPPVSGGDTTYAVVARRPGASSGSEVESAAPATKVVRVSPAPAGALAPPPPDDGGGVDDPGSTGGTDGTGGSMGPGSPGGSGSGGGVTVPRTGSGRGSPGVRVPRVGTPSQGFFPPLLSPPAPEDTGFTEELPFEDREPGQPDAVLPDDELAAGPAEVAAGRGLVIPAATGLVLAVWALHLRFLARAARPQYLDERALPDL